MELAPPDPQLQIQAPSHPKAATTCINAKFQDVCLCVLLFGRNWNSNERAREQKETEQIHPSSPHGMLYGTELCGRPPSMHAYGWISRLVAVPLYAIIFCILCNYRMVWSIGVAHCVSCCVNGEEAFLKAPRKWFLFVFSPRISCVRRVFHFHMGWPCISRSRQ